MNISANNLFITQRAIAQLAIDHINLDDYGGGWNGQIGMSYDGGRVYFELMNGGNVVYFDGTGRLEYRAKDHWRTGTGKVLLN